MELRLATGGQWNADSMRENENRCRSNRPGVRSRYATGLSPECHVYLHRRAGWSCHGRIELHHRMNIVVTTGGSINSIVGSSYWFYQVSPFGGPFPFAITGFNGTGSLFTTTIPT